MSLLSLPQDETLVDNSQATFFHLPRTPTNETPRELPFDLEDLEGEPKNKAACDIRRRLSREKGALGFYTINPHGELATQFLTQDSIRRALTLKILRRDEWAVPDDKLVRFCLEEAFSLFLMLLIHIGGHPGGVLRMAMEKLMAKGLDDKNVFPIRPLSDTVSPESSIADSATMGLNSSLTERRSGNNGSIVTNSTYSDRGSISDGGSGVQFDEEERRILLEHRLGSVDPEIFDRELIGDLYESQWKYPGRLPIFSSGTGGTNLSIHESSILPFTRRGGDEEIQRGAFGEVSRVWIHKAHINDDAGVLVPLPESFALKKILPQEPSVREEVEKELKSSKQGSEWAKELGNMRHVSSLKLDHCVRFFTGFRCYREARNGRKDHTQFYLLFEWANGGTLGQLWTKHHPTPKLSGNIIKQSIVQLLGMAKALARIHEQPNNKTGDESNMRHGDLKPGNILRFVKEPEDPADPIGTLKIGDWGLAKHHNLATQLRIAGTSTKYATLRYEPPEAYYQPDKPTCRLYDIWSMGCIILEYIIWLMYGKTGLEAFHNNLQANTNNNRPETTPFYNTEGGNGVVDEVPRGWMAHLATDPCCQPDTPLGVLLDIVRTKLLVVALPSERSRTMTLKKSSIPVRSLGPSDLRPRVFRRGSSGLGRTSPVPSTPQVPGIVISKPSTPSHPPATPRQSPQPEGDGPKRGLAKDLEDSLQDILSKGHKDPTNYWARGIDTDGHTRKPPKICRQRAQETLAVPSTHGPSDSAAPPHPGKSEKLPAAELRIAGNPNQTVYGPLSLDMNWSFEIDNQLPDLMAAAINGNGDTLSKPEPNVPTELCDNCKKIDFSDLALNFDRDTEDLTDSCHLCGLINDVYTEDHRASAGAAEVKFRKEGSTLVMNESGTPTLSIVGRLGTNTRDDIQSGLPQLPAYGNRLQFEIAKQWLLRCDEYHQATCQHRPLGPGVHLEDEVAKLPTRVLVVGKEGDKTVRLWETGPDDTGKYIALSHRWGSAPFPNGGKTTVANKRGYIKRGINLERLPNTFRDAVKATRALDVPYLWIDSLCIVQSSKAGKGDFDVEAERMESVFSGAYCVLAASRATGMSSGFLGPRSSDRAYVTVNGGGESEEPLYICRNIDDFDKDVLKGHLNTRGWVYQERALARRTLFFTDQQMYFECGIGISCETMSKMRNTKASFLGDPNFPRIVLDAKPGVKIANFQELYKTYSGLHLSYNTDRPFAIQGLECRLLRALGASGGGLGIIDDGRGLLRRSLLWVRKEGDNEDGSPNQMVPIPGVKLPSWSWMAYTGQIDYLTPPSGDTEWRSLRMCPDLAAAPAAGTTSGNDRAIVAPVRDIIAKPGLAPIGSADEANLVYDVRTRARSDGERGVQCVVMGVGKTNRMHYVLLVERSGFGTTDNGGRYRRVGAGSLPESLVGPVGTGPDAKIY